MRYNRLAEIIAFVMLAVAALFVWLPSSRGQAPDAKAGMVWEYKSFFYNSRDYSDKPVHAELNKLGAERWELVAVMNSGDLSYHICVLKRPKQ